MKVRDNDLTLESLQASESALETITRFLDNVKDENALVFISFIDEQGSGIVTNIKSRTLQVAVLQSALRLVDTDE